MSTAALTEAVFYILLSLDAPLHGYGIMQNVERLSGGRVRLAAGTLYGALTTLTERGWIEAVGEDEGRRKEYRITPEGRAAVRVELARLQELTANGEALTRDLGVTEMRGMTRILKRGRTYLAGVEELGVTCLGCFWHRAFFRWEDDGRPVEMFSDLASQALEAKCVRIAQLAAAVWCAVNAALLFFRAWLDLDAARGFDELYADLIAAGAPSIAEAWAPRIAMYAAFGLLWLGLTVWGVRGGAHAPEMARAQRRTARSRIDPPGKETTMNDVKKTWCGPVYTLDPEKNGAAVQPPLRRGLAARGHGLAFLPLSSWSAE